MSTLKSSAEDLTLNADGSGNDVLIQSNASTKVTVDGSAGDVKVESGDLFFATAGKGVCLGVTSNTDANTLADYEEGTFTPALTFGGGAASMTGRAVARRCIKACLPHENRFNQMSALL